MPPPQTVPSEQPTPVPAGFVSPFKHVGHDGPCHELKVSGHGKANNLGFAIESSILSWAAKRLHAERDDYGPERTAGIATAVDRLGEWAESAADGTPPIQRGCIQLERTLGRGVRVTAAPQHSSIALDALVDSRFSFSVQSPGNQLLILDQVLYQVTGYDPMSCSLELELVEDYRAASQFRPPGS